MDEVFLVIYDDPYAHGTNCDCSCITSNIEIKGAFATRKLAQDEIDRLVKTGLQERDLSIERLPVAHEIKVDAFKEGYEQGKHDAEEAFRKEKEKVNFT
jgi:hypothetical protein